MLKTFPSAANAVIRGAALGAATWSAYAVTEFVFSSLLFGFTRPYAVFTSWHWQLTVLLLVGFLAVGALLGAVAGLVVFGIARTGIFQDNASTVLESAAALTLVAAYIGNTLSTSLSLPGGLPLLITSLCFAALLLAEMRSSRWSGRLGLLTNPWVIAAVLMGLEQGFDLFNMGTAQQLGGRVQLATVLLTGTLIVLAAASLIIGRRLRPLISGNRWGVATLTVLALVTLSSAALAFSHHTAVQAAPLQALPGKMTGKPNVVLIVMDTVRADHLSLYGYQRETTPNLKLLAQDSAVYTHAQSAADITLTSHASLFTGMYPSWHGAYCQPPEAAYGRELSRNTPTLAEILRGKGYSTLGVAANMYLRSDFGLERGFQKFRIPRPVPLLADENRYQLRRTMRRVLNRVTDTSQFDRLYSRGEDINEDFFVTLDRRQGKTPFFGFLNYMDAHFPYIPPAPFDQKFPGKTSTIPQDDLESQQAAISAGGPIPAEYRPYCLSQYDGGIAYLDAQIGKIVAGLQQRGLYDNTMIVITSDHGEAFGERHRVEHGNSPYQNVLHVALLIKYPKAAQRGLVADAVSLVDVTPTILDATGFPIPASMQGRSLLDRAVDRPAGSARKLFSETFPCPVMQAADCAGCSARTMVSWPFKYIAFNTGKKQLFNLETDPDEYRDLAGTAAPETSQLNGELSAWTKTIPVQSKQRLQLSPEEMKRLKSLGYVGGK